MLRPFVIERVDRIQFCRRLRQRRWVLHQPPVAVLLAQALGADRVVVLIEGVEHFDERHFVLGHRLVAGQLQVPGAFLFRDVTQSAPGPGIGPVAQRSGECQRRFLRHAVEDEIRFRIEQE